MTQQTTDFETLLAQYAAGPDQLQAALDGLAGEDLDLALGPGSWTIRQIVHHVVDGDHLWSIGLKAALGNPQSAFSFPWYWETEQDQWAETWAYGRLDVEPSLARFRATRRSMVQLLEQVAKPWEKRMTVLWPGDKEQTLSAADIVGGQAQHVLGHVEDIKKIRQAHGV